METHISVSSPRATDKGLTGKFFEGFVQGCAKQEDKSGVGCLLPPLLTRARTNTPCHAVDSTPCRSVHNTHSHTHTHTHTEVHTTSTESGTTEPGGTAEIYRGLDSQQAGYAVGESIT